jgi:hypothetical protein
VDGSALDNGGDGFLGRRIANRRFDELMDNIFGRVCRPGARVPVYGFGGGIKGKMTRTPLAAET